MPIGFTGGDLGGSSRPGAAGPKGKTLPSGWASPPPAVVPPVAPWSPVRETARDIGVAVAAVVATLVPVTVEVWETIPDGRACPECGPYDGTRWDEGEGPQPPLHPNCRCRRVPHHVSWRVRP
ncbi:MAG TPA: hypothetical protein VGT61_12080 [Thermomicrobiales bacterium]|jgi:hypothetical protein|nr:hypothetical protein [Thermomicrobiales bacterium]